MNKETNPQELCTMGGSSVDLQELKDEKERIKKESEHVHEQPKMIDAMIESYNELVMTWKHTEMNALVKARDAQDQVDAANTLLIKSEAKINSYETVVKNLEMLKEDFEKPESIDNGNETDTEDESE